MIIGSPNNIEVLLHCYTSPSPHPRAHAPSVKDALKAFENCGVIEPGEEEGVFVTRPLGNAWVRALCLTAIPRSAFIDENGKLIADSRGNAI